MSLWYNLFDFPAIYNGVRYLLLGGKSKMFNHLKKAVDLKVNETLLELGCGPGELSELFDFGYVGLDISERYVKSASKKYPGKSFICGDAKSYVGGKFDKILLASFMHHFSEQDLEQIFKNLKSVAKKRVIVLDPVPFNNPISLFLYKMDRGADIRPLEKQKEIISKYFNVKESYIFKSLFYKLSIIVAEPKDLKREI